MSTAAPTKPITERYNPLGIIALAFGVLSYFVLPVVGALTAVITGHIALRQIKLSGERGHEIALWGTILGYIHLALGILVALVIIVVIAMFGLGVVGVAVGHAIGSVTS